MVLPGIQTLFGFQLIAVFNQRFADVLPEGARVVHLIALILIAVAIALIMAPAAYHRQAERATVSKYFANYASRLIAIAMLPLLIAISAEVSLVAYAILAQFWPSVVCGSLLAILFLWLWFIFPALRRRATRRAGLS